MDLRIRNNSGRLPNLERSGTQTEKRGTMPCYLRGLFEFAFEVFDLGDCNYPKIERILLSILRNFLDNLVL